MARVGEEKPGIYHRGQRVHGESEEESSGAKMEECGVKFEVRRSSASARGDRRRDENRRRSRAYVHGIPDFFLEGLQVQTLISVGCKYSSDFELGGVQAEPRR